MKISAQKRIFSMSSKNMPATDVGPGNVVAFETMDCFANGLACFDRFFGSIDWHGVNPATGPLSIHGVLPGDTLKAERGARG